MSRFSVSAFILTFSQCLHGAAVFELVVVIIKPVVRALTTLTSSSTIDVVSPTIGPQDREE